MVQLMSTFSSPVSLSVSAARTNASAQLEHAVRHDEPPVSGMHMSCGSATVMVLVGLETLRAEPQRVHFAFL